MTSEPKKRSQTAKWVGLVLAGMGLAHFASPQIFEPITKPAFPDNTRRHVYANGGIETTLGLGLTARQTRPLAIAGTIGYLAYLFGNASRKR